MEIKNPNQLFQRTFFDNHRNCDKINELLISSQLHHSSQYTSNIVEHSNPGLTYDFL